MKDVDGFTIAIVGLGLMGGSLAMALKRNRVGHVLLGADVDEQNLARAIEAQVIDGRCERFADCDLIVLAMPVRAIIAWLESHAQSLSAESIVMDLGSTKAEIVRAMEHVAAQCIGGHPMCGKETSGLAAADARLLEGAKFVLTPTARTQPETTRLAQTIVQRVGAQPLLMRADEHDRAVAAISHLPYLLSASLVNSVAARQDEQAALLAASGYQSTTRLAASDPRMMGDIVLTNRANVLTMLDEFQQELTSLRTAIAAHDDARWQARLAQAQQTKRELHNTAR